jgi:hypothetical protein
VVASHKRKMFRKKVILFSFLLCLARLLLKLNYFNDIFSLSLYKVRVEIRINWFLDFVHRPVIERTLKKTTFRNLDLFPSSGGGGGGRETPALLSSLERGNFNH